MVRLLSNGTLDNSFDSDGRLTISIGSGNDEAYGISVRLMTVFSLPDTVSMERMPILRLFDTQRTGLRQLPTSIRRTLLQSMLT